MEEVDKLEGDEYYKREIIDYLRSSFNNYEIEWQFLYKLYNDYNYYANKEEALFRIDLTRSFTTDYLELKVNRKINSTNPPYIRELYVMKEDFDWIYEQLDIISFNLMKDITNEIYNRTTKIRYSFFDDFVEIKNKLYNYSNLIYKYINISSEDIANYNVDSIKENITLILKEYNKTLENYVKISKFENYLQKHDQLFKIDISHYSSIVREFFNTLNYKHGNIKNNYLEYPQKILDALDFYGKYLDNKTQWIEELEDYIDSFIQNKLFPNIFTTIQLYLNNIIERDFEGQISRINNKTSIFFSESMSKEKDLFYEVLNQCKLMAYELYPLGSNFSYLFENETFKYEFYGLHKDGNIYEVKNQIIYDMKNKYDDETPQTKNDIISDYIAENKGKYEKYTNVFKGRLNEYYIKSLMSYSAKFSSHTKEIINDDDKKTLVISDKDLDYAVEFYDKNKIKELNESLNSVYQNQIGSFSSLFDQKIKIFLENYIFNYTEITEEYKKIVEWKENSFIDYINDYFNGLKTSIDDLIQDYIDSLDDNLKYTFLFDMDWNTFENYFNNLVKDFRSELNFNIQDFQHYFQNKINKHLQEIKESILEYIAPYNETIIEIGINKIQLYDYIIKKIEDIDQENKRYQIDDIPNYSHTQFLDKINSIIKSHFDDIGKKMESTTSNFIKKVYNKRCVSFNCRNINNIYLKCH